MTLRATGRWGLDAAWTSWISSWVRCARRASAAPAVQVAKITGTMTVSWRQPGATTSPVRTQTVPRSTAREVVRPLAAGAGRVVAYCERFRGCCAQSDTDPRCGFGVAPERSRGDDLSHGRRARRSRVLGGGGSVGRVRGAVVGFAAGPGPSDAAAHDRPAHRAGDCDHRGPERRGSAAGLRPDDVSAVAR